MKKITLLLICAVAFWPILAHGAPVQVEGKSRQTGSQRMMPGREMFQKDGKAWDRMASVRFYKLIEFLGLTTEEANKLAPAIQARDNGRKDYFQARDKALDNLAELVEKGASQNELKKAVAGTKVLDDGYQAKEKGLTNKVLELLPPEKQAKYYLFNRHFTQEIRQGLYNMAERRIKERSEKARPGVQPPR
ncbi:MAG: hypothetical protein ABII89_04265 [Candidatus Omnitrophota bacterium]